MTQKSTSSQILDKNGLTEKEFLLRYNADKYPKPSLTADICVVDHDQILLVKRGNHPYIGKWALPGGFADRNEALEDTARRELKEETSLDAEAISLIGVYSRPGRDPRGWVVSAAYRMDVDRSRLDAKAGDDAAKAEWFTVRFCEEGMRFEGCGSFDESELAFDHAEIIRDAFGR